MSASNLLSQEKPVADRKAYEPSMEEILASIRRIISDDQSFQSGHSAEEAAQPQTDAPDQHAGTANTEIAEKACEPSPAIRSNPAPAAAADTRKVDAEIAFVPLIHRSEAAKPADPPAQVKPQIEPARARNPAEAPMAPRVSRQPDMQAQAPASAEARAEPAKAPQDFGRRRNESAELTPADAAAPLVSPATDQTVSSAFNALVASRLMQSHETMAEMVREMIRPMLKAWLDDNLPIMVERLVRAEIERVARSGR